MKNLVILALIVSTANCTRTATLPSERDSSSTPPTKAKAAKSDDVDKVPHPQSAVLKDGRLETYTYFAGSSRNGKIFPTGSATSPRSGTLTGRNDDTGATIQARFRLVHDFDSCARDDNNNRVGDLPLYRIADDHNNNLCEGSTLTIFDPSELDRCADKNTVELKPKIDNFNKVHGLAVAIPGYWDAGVHHRDDTKMTLACITGVAAKCAHWGYVPWASHGAGHPDLWDYYESCVSAAMATYNDRGESYTCGSTAIEIFDKIGIQKKTDPLPYDHQSQMTIESLWNHTADGDLLCMRHARFAGCEDDFRGTATRPRHPKYHEDCSDENVKYDGWKIGVASIPNTIPDSSGSADPIKCPHGTTGRDICQDL